MNLRRPRVPSREAGQTLAEYALILMLVAMAAVAALTALGTTLSTLWSTVATLP